MKKFMKALATVLTIAAFAAVPAMAEAPAAENAVVETQEAKAVETLFGANIDETGAAIGLEKTQTQGEGEFDAYLTMYENPDITIGGHDGVIVDITLFTNTYEMYGVRIGMTEDEAKAALTERGIAFKDETVAELGAKTIEFDAPDYAGAKCSFEIDDGKINDAHMYTETNAD